MKEYTITTAKNKETKTFEITLEGHLNVANITGIKKELTDTIKNNKKVQIRLANTDDADVTIIQLLMALKKKYNEKNVSVDISFDLDYEISELFSRAGFANTIN